MPSQRGLMLILGYIGMREKIQISHLENIAQLVWEIEFDCQNIFPLRALLMFLSGVCGGICVNC